MTKVRILDMDDNSWETEKVIFQGNMVVFDDGKHLMRMPLHYVKYIAIKKG